MPLIPIREFADWDYSQPRTITCVNHQTDRWYWKGPGRNMHYSGPTWPECPCPYDDLRVMMPDANE